MNSSPSKRRKTSPTTSIPVPKDGAKTPPGRRPSFASPTKASISRHNPQLLARPSSAGKGVERPGSRGRNLDEVFARAMKEVRPSVEGPENAGEEGTQDSTTQENEASSQNTQTPRSARSVRGSMSAKARRKSQSSSKQAPMTLGPAVEIEGVINPFKRTGLRRSPPIASQEDPVLQENINPFQKGGLRRSPASSQPLTTLRQGSVPAELPHEISTTPTEPFSPRAVDTAFRKDPTPTPQTESVPVNNVLPEQVNAVEPTASKSPDRQQIQAQQVESESWSPVPFVVQPPNPPYQPDDPDLPPTPVQLGIPDPVVTTPPSGIHDTPSKRAKGNRSLRKQIKSSPLKPRDAPPAKALKQSFAPEPQSSERSDASRKSARFLFPPDPHAAKKKELNDVRRELELLQADIALANKENERLRLHSESKRSPPSPSSNSDELVSMLLRCTATEPQMPIPKPVSILKSVDSFLPFSSRRKSHQRIANLGKPIPSHLPIAVDNPLPYLQAFSPLTYTSTITLLPSEPESPNTTGNQERPMLQRHLINASHSSGLFHSRLSMIVDSKTLSINSLDISRLDSAAEKELGTFVRQRANENATVNKEVGVICWAMNRWVETSILRARFWCAVDCEFGTPEVRAKSFQRKKKRKLSRAVVDDNGISRSANHDEEEERKKQSYTRRQLLPHMGRTAMELVTDDVEVRFEWNLEVDWTGEVESVITAASRLPQGWEESNNRKSLFQVPELFDRLVIQDGPLAAVRSIVELLFPVT